MLDPDRLAITLRPAALVRGLNAGVEDERVQLEVPLQFRRRGVEMKLLIPSEAHRPQPQRPDPALIKALARGHLWFEDLATGRAASLRDIAKRDRITEGYVGRLIRLAFLAPSIVETILEGSQAVELTAARLTDRTGLPLDWTEQHRLICG